jgi:Gas vesicle synthesis protein GvpL/GvpF
VATSLKRSQSPTVVYLYGVTAKSVKGLALTGVDGKAAVEPIADAGLVCWVSHVPQMEFADNLAKNMENLDWLSEAGVRHQRVVSAIAEVADILPARFGTVFLDPSTLNADLRKRKKLLASDLRKIHGCDEWGVKVFAIPHKMEAPAKKPTTGRDYLKTKAALLRRPSIGIATEDLEAFSTALRRISINMADGGGISRGIRGLQWQSSILLKRGNRKKLEAVLKKYSQKWVSSGKIECTGPWPPYSFVSGK